MPAPDCPPDDALRGLLEGSLDPAAVPALDAHVSDCPACERRLAGIHPDGAGFLVWQGFLDSSPDLRGLTPELHTLPDAPTLLGGFGKYHVEREIGRGGMGVVYRATDTHLRRPVALKVMVRAAAASRTARARFLQEARAAAAIRSDHVVTLYEADEIGGTPYLAFELLDGATLETAGRLPVVEVVRVLRQAAAGLDAAHRLGFVHRDIKPSNLWVQARTRTVKILDFGLTRADPTAPGLTASGAVLGTPGYLAPEQARGEPVDSRTDLFGLGATAYRLLTGAVPFPGPTPLAALTALATADPAPVLELRPDCPPALAKLVHRMLAKDPAGRPPSAADFLGELDAAVPTDRPDASALAAARPTPTRRRWVGVGLVAAVLAAAVVIAVAFLRPPAAAPPTPSADPPAAERFSFAQLPLLPADRRKPWHPPELVAVIGADGGYFGHPAHTLPPVFTPDGKYLISPAGVVMDADTLDVLPPPGHPAARTGKAPVAFHPTTGWAVYADGEVIDWADPTRPTVAKYKEIADLGTDDLSVAFSAGGHWLYAAPRPGAKPRDAKSPVAPNGVLCDLPTPTECRRPSELPGSIDGHFSPNGKWFVNVRDGGKQVEVIELEGLKQLAARDLPVRDGRTAVAARADDDGRVLVIDDGRGRELHAPDGAKMKRLDREEQAELTATALSPLVPLPGGGGYLAGGGTATLAPGTATQVIRTAGGKLRPEAVVAHPEYYLSGLVHLLVHPNGRSVFADTAFGFFDRSPLDGREVRITPALRFRAGHPAHQPLVVSNDGRYLFAKTDDDRMRAYDFQTGRVTAVAPQVGKDRVSDVAVFTAGADGCVVRENDWTAKVFSPGRPAEPATAPPDCLLLAGSTDLTTFFGFAREGRGYRLRRPNDPPEGIDLGGRGEFNDVVRLSPDATRLVVVPVWYRGHADDYTVRAIDLTTPQPTVKAFPVRVPEVVAVRPNGRRVAVARGSETIKYLDPDDGREADGPFPQCPVSWLDYSPDGERLLVTSRHRDGPATVAVHACGSGLVQQSWTVPHATHAKFTPDGGHVLVNTTTGGIWLLRLP